MSLYELPRGAASFALSMLFIHCFTQPFTMATPRQPSAEDLPESHPYEAITTVALTLDMPLPTRSAHGSPATTTPKPLPFNADPGVLQLVAWSLICYSALSLFLLSWMWAKGFIDSTLTVSHHHYVLLYTSLLAHSIKHIDRY